MVDAGAGEHCRRRCEQDPEIAAACLWHPPFTKMEPVETIVAKIVAPDLLCLFFSRYTNGGGARLGRFGNGVIGCELGSLDTSQ